MAFCIPLGLFMFLLFVLLRSKIPLFYHRNILYNGKLVLTAQGDAAKKFGKWFKGLMSLKDVDRLRLGGLDSLVLTNSFRLILILTCIMSIPCLLILIPYYFTHSDTSNGVSFTTFTIADLYTDTFWPPLFVLIFLTALIIYGIYSFYVGYIRLRQIFLLRPSGMNSLRTVLTSAEYLGSLKDSQRRFDSATCTVLLHPIPPDIPSQNLHQFLEDSGIKGIKSIQIVGDYKLISESMKKRNSSLKKLEAALKSVSTKLEKPQLNKTGDSDILTLKERTDLIHDLITDQSFCSTLRPRHKTSKPALKDPEPPNPDGTVDSIRHHYKKFLEREDQLQEAIKSFNDPVIDQIPTINNLQTESDDNNFEERYIEETSFISWNKVTNFTANFSNISTLDSSKSALLHFSNYLDACKAQQLLLTSRPNAMKSEMAPGPDDINWKYIKWSQRKKWRGALKSNLAYWLLVIAFAPIVTSVVAFIDLQSLGKFIPALENFRQNHPNFRAILEGVLAPLCATLLLKRTGVWTTNIILLRGPISKSELALKVQSAHLFFLVIQIIFIGAIFSNLYEFTATTLISNFKMDGILVHLRESLPKKAHFFFNFMIQDIFNELMLELLNPKSLFFDRFFISKSGRKSKSIRSLLQHDTLPPELETAVAWSRFIMFPFFILMTYIITAPLIIIPAMAYYSVAYFVFTFRYAHYGRVNADTGGMFWKQAAQQMLYALIICQLVALLQYSQFRKGFVPSLILILLLGLTIAFIPFLKLHFGKIINSISVLESDFKESKRTLQAILHEQNTFIPQVVNCFENSEIVKSKLESDLKDYFNFIDIDPSSTTDTKAISISNMAVQDSETVFQPYWSITPLNRLKEEEQGQLSYDPFQVDNFVDVQHSKQQYEHPLMMKHTQILIVPSDLPLQLKSIKFKY